MMQKQLSIIGTPIGNVKDITYRAIETFKTLDLLLTEDTRVTGKLLSYYGMKVKMMSYNAHKERQNLNFKTLFDKYPSIGLVSDAGTPGISDPGATIINYCHENGIPVIPIPGVSALTTCLSITGMASKDVLFLGFLPKKKQKRRQILDQALKSPVKVVILYESPYQIKNVLALLCEYNENLYGVLGRELSKRYEEIIKAPVKDLLARCKERPIRGEVVLAIETQNKL